MPCEHKYVYLRKDIEEEGGFRPTRNFFDVFFCEKCLAYKKIKVSEQRANGFDSGYHEVSCLPV